MSNPSNPENNYDPAGSTQMFRAFVDEEPVQQSTATYSSGGGNRVGLIAGIVAVVVVLAAVAWFAFS